MSSQSLKSLRDRPFELLAELERRGRAVSAQAEPGGARRARMGRRGAAHGRGPVPGGARGDARGARRARAAPRACRARSPGSGDSPTCAASCCRSSTCGSSSAAASTPITRNTRVRGGESPRDPGGAAGGRGARLPALRGRRSSRAMRRRPWRAASAIWRARSAARTSSGRCSACARCSRVPRSRRRPHERGGVRTQPGTLAAAAGARRAAAGG